MRMFRLPRLATTALALLAAGGTALAASPAPRVIEVPAGAVVLVLPGGAVPMMTANTAPVLAFDGGLPSPVAMIRQMDQMMQQAFGDPSGDRLMAAGLRQMQAGFTPGQGFDGPVSQVVVTTVSNGRESCTRQVTYSGDGAAPKMAVRMTGNGCAGAGLPAAAPAPTVPLPSEETAPRTLRVNSRHPGTLQVAQLER